MSFFKEAIEEVTAFVTDSKTTQTCPDCNGTGLKDEHTICPTCEGTGTI